MVAVAELIKDHDPLKKGDKVIINRVYQDMAVVEARMGDHVILQHVPLNYLNIISTESPGNLVEEKQVSIFDLKAAVDFCRDMIGESAGGGERKEWEWRKNELIKKLKDEICRLI